MGRECASLLAGIGRFSVAGEGERDGGGHEGGREGQRHMYTEGGTDKRTEEDSERKGRGGRKRDLVV